MASDLLKKIKMQYIFFVARRLPACDELLPLQSLKMDKQLSWRQRWTLLLHNHICEVCKRYANQLLLIRQAMKQEERLLNSSPATETGLSAGARERMKQALRKN